MFTLRLFSLFPDNLDECDQCKIILEELENIDDDCDRHGITFVKTQVTTNVYNTY